MKKKYMAICSFILIFSLQAVPVSFAAEDSASIGTLELPSGNAGVEEQGIINGEETKILSVGKDYIDSFQQPNSQNWYTFIPNESGSYRMSFSNYSDLRSVLYDETKSKVITEGRAIDGENTYEIAQTLIKGKTYYIKVAPNTADFADQYRINMELLDNPNDPYFSKQWGLFNSKNGLDINIIPVWKHFMGQNMKVAIADTGEDYHHKDLVKNTDLSLSYNFTHNVKEVFPQTEYQSDASAKAGHGTHVAGIIAAEVNNGEGIAGIAPNLKLVPLKVLGSRLSDSAVYTGSIAAFVKAVEYAKKNDVRIMNCSFGGAIPAETEKAAMLEAKDILFVIAGGNLGNDLSKDPEYPACYYHDNSMVVAALNQEGKLAGFSNYGGPTDIAAPGDSIYSTYPNNGYVNFSGTSMAAPVVTAIAGLVLDKYEDLKPLEVRNIITDVNNVTRLDALSGKVKNSGMINAYKAITSGRITNISNDESESSDLFERNVKGEINYYKTQAEEDIMTDQVIVKFADYVDVNKMAADLKEKNNFEKMEQIACLNMIDSYVYQFSNKEEADVAVNLLNSCSEVVYAEPNYLRK